MTEDSLKRGHELSHAIYEIKAMIKATELFIEDKELKYYITYHNKPVGVIIPRPKISHNEVKKIALTGIETQYKTLEELEDEFKNL